MTTSLRGKLAVWTASLVCVARPRVKDFSIDEYSAVLSSSTHFGLKVTLMIHPTPIWNGSIAPNLAIAVPRRCRNNAIESLPFYHLITLFLDSRHSDCVFFSKQNATMGIYTHGALATLREVRCITLDHLVLVAFGVKAGNYGMARLVTN